MARRRQETMEENRAKLIAAGRKAFAEKGYAAASMDELTADVGLTRGALYHNFGDKRGLLAAVVNQIDSEMAARAKEIGSGSEDGWQAMLAEGGTIEMALVECFNGAAEPDTAEVAALLDRHRAWISRMWGKESSPLGYAGLADLYLTHPGFRERFDGHAAGFTEWLSSAMKLYAADLAAG